MPTTEEFEERRSELARAEAQRFRMTNTASASADNLDAVSIGALAEAIRDERWVDMRVVDVGTCERVMVTQLKIAREKDMVVIRQKWENPAEEILTDEFEFDTEDIRWLRDTQKAIDAVQPLRLILKANTPTPGATPGKDGAHIIAEIIRTVAFLTQGVSEADLRAGNLAPGVVRPRQEAMWLAFEMTDLAPAEICERDFGYMSEQPLLSIAQKLRRADETASGVNRKELPGEWITRVRGARGLIDTNLGQAYRRPHTIGPNWKRYL